MPDPKGVIAIWTDAAGEVIATVADFDRSGYGGFKLWEAQRMRSESQVKAAAIRAYCSPAVTDALSNYLYDQISREMLQRGHKLNCVAVGWPEDVAAEISRK